MACEACKPFMTGMDMSMSTQSNDCDETSCTASSPLKADATAAPAWVSQASMSF